jgi:hypothetical protein
MLDQVLEFANGVNSPMVNIRVYIAQDGERHVLVEAAGASRPVSYTEQSIRNSKGGVLNDWRLQSALNKQLGK